VRAWRLNPPRIPHRDAWQGNCRPLVQDDDSDHDGEHHQTQADEEQPQPVTLRRMGDPGLVWIDIQLVTEKHPSTHECGGG
jgi:hypothetical protein